MVVYLNLDRELKKAVEHEGDSDINFIWSINPRPETNGTGDQWKK